MMPTEEPAEDLRHPLSRPLLVEPHQPGAFKCLGIGLEKPGRAAGLILIGMRDERAPLRLLENESESIERLGRAHPGEIIGADIDLRLEVIDVLLEHEWQGNVRELANVMEHAYILAGGGNILPEHVPYSVRRPAGEAPRLSLSEDTESASPSARTLREVEMEHVLRVLDKHGGSKTKAAEELGISLKTMYNKLNQLHDERKAAG